MFFTIYFLSVILNYLLKYSLNLGIPLKDENNHEPTVQARQLGVNGRGQRVRHQPRMTAIEIGMYVLLAAFCFAIVVCFLFHIMYNIYRVSSFLK